jgi:hypothetical protein
MAPGVRPLHTEQHRRAMALPCSPRRSSHLTARWRQSHRLWNRNVSFSTAIRSVAETIALFQETLSQTAGVRILPANMPIPPAHATVEFGANNEPAGSVLLGLFAKLSPTPMSYRLLFDPNSRAYDLSICSFPYALAKPVPCSPAPRNLAPKSAPTVPSS